MSRQSTEHLNENSDTGAALNSVLKFLCTTIDSAIPPEKRNQFIESLLTLLLRGILPRSGITLQQIFSADLKILAELNAVMDKGNAYENGTDLCFVYQYAREASSAGIIPIYRNKATGAFYILMISNNDTPDQYNWAGGYTEAPYPRWNGKLQSESEKGRDIVFDRDTIVSRARDTMLKLLNDVGGDWTKLDFIKHYQEFLKALQSVLPFNIDINSIHTAQRELDEETLLDLDQFPQRKIILNGYDNTVGISQGDGPGQLSNRCHQYMV